ncbi:hypothetical protein LZ578_09995 [Jeotgalibaca sp. MA1X17-3]|uniref:amidase family protein n=1 Tax=Jeotgalibaca sp. MA1X17-3 TaxID=2908211 RepID=UPI001EEF4B16|nr:amidase family protein [Jeotgalibaca sp. MA1X17-3]UJF15293.1 hypothetical protein LZ578_09995 [Jeotgalibaca sp. MA1X17-3]
MEPSEWINVANQTFIAMKNPYESVEKVYPRALEKYSVGSRYMGVKNKVQIPRHLIEQLETFGYILHTLDKASMGGRAIDVSLTNPISGRPMTGSSSGTAINVLLGINDLGIGTDGGGSVLAPAMAVQLFGFICPIIEQEHLENFSSTSTDGIGFHASIGFMSREFEVILHAIQCVLPLEDTKTIASPRIFATGSFDDLDVAENVKVVQTPNLFGEREPLIDFLKENLPQCDFLISKEGPADFLGFGDTVLGHLGNEATRLQQSSGKGLIRVANMVDATALVVPTKDFACGYVLLCESTLPKVKAMLEFAKTIALPQDPLLKKYFQNIENYFPDEFI